jgi:hypothetical protein
VRDADHADLRLLAGETPKDGQIAAPEVGQANDPVRAREGYRCGTAI